MLEKSYTLVSETGLHARPATNFVRFMSTLPSNVYIIHKEFVADAKSIMAVMSMGLSKGATFKIRIDSDQTSVLNDVERYLKENHLI
ncbi:MAG: phosphocarrier protein HPr [Tenericutes bacterium HGW-Tenericutes-6]|jgi:phosphocarrier protein|nr:MAG: phosphocarrier protein HPr [Tenericutes bacterium HGW-Tenericutes-7]PKK94081.1 MAG: phosphocarrier protein HPr [Tenericutes bacterium HGW-Tenericutes-6]